MCVALWSEFNAGRNLQVQLMSWILFSATTFISSSFKKNPTKITCTQKVRHRVPSSAVLHDSWSCESKPSIRKQKEGVRTPRTSTCCSVSEVLFGAPHDFVSHWERFSRGCLSFTAAHLSSVMRWQVSFLTASMWDMIPLFHLSPTSRLDQSARFDFWRGHCQKTDSVCLLPEPFTCWNNKHCGKRQVTVQLILDRGEKSALHASAERPRRAQHCRAVLPVDATHLRYKTKLLLRNWSQVKHICQVTYVTSANYHTGIFSTGMQSFAQFCLFPLVYGQ